MMPRPPARDTAEASWVRASQPIGACTMGYLAPVWARTRFMTIRCCEGETGGRIPGRYGKFGWATIPAQIPDRVALSSSPSELKVRAGATLE
jgi:hypothetical protein